MAPRRGNLVAVSALVASTALGGRLASAAEPPDSARLALPFVASLYERTPTPAVIASRTGEPGALDRLAQALAPPLSDTTTYRFDIPAGALDATLRAFAVLTGVTVDSQQIPADALGMMTSPGVRGVWTRRQALDALLTGTSLVFRETGPSAVTIQIQGTDERVSVTGRNAHVTSPKLTEPLRDIPQTITVIPASVIAQQNATTLRDVLRNVSGITFQAGEGGVPAGDQLTIRGFSARTDLFIDCVRDFGGYSRDPFNMEQVEVSKGPSSSLVGRGSTGGAVNQVSKAPTSQAATEVTIGVGHADYVRTTIDLNHPLQALGSNTAFRLNAMFTSADTPGRNEVGGERWGVAPSLAFGSGTATRLTLSYFHLRQDTVPEYGIPWVPATTNPELVPYANGRPPVDRRNYYGLT
ncbi:MAG: TonB-dependent receptor plug domain-containing protein [Acidobacteria bacterium]|nr:TonB-dependent receptor plug domain-containing protein [Acidobacteriota bacterium]